MIRLSLGWSSEVIARFAHAATPRSTRIGASIPYLRGRGKAHEGMDGKAHEAGGRHSPRVPVPRGDAGEVEVCGGEEQHDRVARVTRWR